MGQEWGASSPFLYFTDHGEELGRLVTEGRRKEFATFEAFADPGARERIPDPQAESTFQLSRLGWPERGREPHEGLLRLYRAALALRREHGLGGLERSEYSVSGRDGELVLVVRRPGRDTLLVVVRLGGAGTLEPESPGEGEGPPWRVVLSTEDRAFNADPRPPVVTSGEDGGLPRVGFRRAGALALVRAGDAP
jgi:maltooligosyltrehalose trehalohydrolase